MQPTEPMMKKALDGLADAVGNALRFFDGIDKADLTTLLKFYKQIHEVLELFEIQHESLQHVHDNLSYELLPSLMEDMKIDSVKAHGRTFSLSTRINAHISEEQRTSGLDWVRNTALVPGAIVEHVNPRTLTSIVKSYFEANGQWPPESAVKVYQKKYISVRKR